MVTVASVQFDLDSLVAAVAAEGRGVELLGARLWSGWENVVLETTDGWILRFPRPGVAFDRELLILRRLAGRLPVAIPKVEWTGRGTRFAAYRRLDGSTFDLSAYLEAPEPLKDVLAGSLAQFLAAMHGSLAPVEVEELAIPVFDSRSIAEPDGLDLDRVPAGVRRAVEGTLDEARSRWARDRVPGPRVVLHDDFHFGNMVLSEPVGVVTGVWDFSCVTLGEPTLDMRYFAGDSMDLVRRVAVCYEQLTGRGIDVRAAVLAKRAEDIADAFELGEPQRLEGAVASWRLADSE